jgi:hypothetical protein
MLAVLPASFHRLVAFSGDLRERRRPLLDQGSLPYGSPPPRTLLRISAASARRFCERDIVGGAEAVITAPALVAEAQDPGARAVFPDVEVQAMGVGMASRTEGFTLRAVSAKLDYLRGNFSVGTRI